MNRKVGLVLLAGASSALAYSAPHARAADFYAGKELRIVIRADPGGNYDLYSRVLIQHMVQHIPGHPTPLPINMPGGSGMTALNYVVKTAPPDGTYLTMVTPSFPMEQTMGTNKNLHIDFSRMNWIGNLSDANTFLLTSKISPIKSLADAEARATMIGVPSQEDVTAYMVRLTNRLMGTKFRLVAGYPSGPEMNLAMRRGEIDGRGTSEPQTLLTSRDGPPLQRQFNFILQMGLKKDMTFPNAPLLTDLAANRDQRTAYQFLSEAAALARPIATGPGVPADRVAILRAAFDATMKDPAFLADAAKAGLQVVPMSGADLQKLVVNIVQASPQTVSFIKKTLEAR